MESSKNKTIGAWILAFFALMSGGTYGAGTMFGGTGVTPTVEQWLATTTPNVGITQRIFGKDLIFSGLEGLDCLGTDATGLVGEGTCAAGSGGSGTVGTSTVPTVGQLAYWTNNGYPSLLGSVATGTLSASGPLSVTAGRSVIGGSAALSITQAGTSQDGYLSSTDWNTFNNKIGWGQATSTSPNQIVYTNAAGKLVSVASSSLSLPNTALQNSSITVNTSGGLTGGASVSLGGTLNLSSFSYPFPSDATTTSLMFSKIGVARVNNGQIGVDVDVNDVDLTQGLRVRGASASTLGFSAFVDGDNFVRFVFNADGTLAWGGGAAGTDTTLSRTAANVLSLGSGDRFEAGNASTTLFSTSYASSTVWRGGGLNTDCDNATNSKLLWDATTGQFSCGSDQGAGGGITTLGPTGQGQTGSTQTLATSTNGTDFTITATGDVQTFNLPIASAANTGKLSATDWSTFNNKISWGAATSTSPNQIVYTNAAGKLVSVASSSLALPNASLANSTISGIALGSNLADLTATNGTLTFSGTYNGSTARTIGLNLANANTWTALQQFSNATSTLFSSTYASTTNQVIGNNLTFGGVTGTSWSDFCTSITGGSGLCDGTDDTGGGGSGVTASTTADVIIYKKGSTYYAYNATTTVTTSNSSFATLLQAQVNLFDDCPTAATCTGGVIYIQPGNYYSDTTVTINGNDNGGDDDSGSVTIEGAGQDATKIVMNNNASFLDFDHAAMPKVRNLSVYLKGSSSAFISDSASNNARAVWNFEFTNIHIAATTTTTGYGFNLGNAFRGTFTNIEMFDLHTCARFVAEGTFNPGDFVWSRSFCELDSASGAITFQFAQNSTGFYNQMSFINAEGIANGTGASFLDATGLAYSQWYGINAEQYDVLADFHTNSANNNIQFNYATHRDSVASLRGCRFWSGASGNTCNFGFLNTTANFTVVDDMNSFTDSPNVIMGYIGADAGTASASTSASAVTIYRDISGYGTLDTNLAPGGRFGLWQFVGDLVAKGASAVVNFANAIKFIIPSGTSHTFADAGDLYFDTTDMQLQIATTSANSPRAIPTITKLWSGTVASTSVDFASGGRIPLPAHRDAVVITEIDCNVDGGTSKVIGISSLAGTADTDTVTCGTTNTADTSMSANYDISAARLNSLEMGATTGSVDYVTFSVWGYVKPE